MGRKYASLHIRLEDLDNDIDAAKKSYASVMDTIFPTDIKEAAGRLGLRISPEQLSAVNAFVKMGLSYSRKKQKTLEHNGFVSVYDERMTFENVQAIAQKLSAILKARVFFSSVYDDDVFLFGLCEDGETISLHISGNCEAYGMEQATHDIGDLERYVSNGEKKVPLQALCGPGLENALIESFGFQLNIK